MNRIEELEKLIRYHSYKYYNELPEISDAAFDELTEELKQLNPNSSVFDEIGATVAFERKWKKTQHKMPMGSLTKIKVEDISDIFDKIRNTCLVVTEKFDGLSIELVYRNSVLVEAITRGDGDVGEDILQNVLKMKNVQQNLDLAFKFDVSIRGEIIMLKSDFAKVNELTDNSFANPRNAAAGIAKGHDGKFCEYLTVKYYGVQEDLSERYTTDSFKHETGKLHFLNDRGLIDDLSNYFVQVYDETQLMAVYEKYRTHKRESLDYNIDGLVLTMMDVEMQNRLGYLHKKPKFAWALKFPPAEKKSILLAVDWTVTRTGRVNPVAKIEPIEIDGSVVQYASLHNLDYIRKLGLGINDEVMVKKAGDIIPAIVEVVIHKGDPIAFPAYCPDCRSNLVNTDNFLWCMNPNCPSQLLAKLIRYCKILEMDYVGGGLLEKLFNSGLAKWPIDLYEITKNDLLKFDGVGDSIADNFLRELEKKSKLPLQKFIVSLSLDGLAEKNAGILANHVEKNYMSFNHFMRVFTREDLSSLFTEQTTDKIFLYLSEEKEEILDLLNKVSIEKLKISSKLEGKSFCITGSLEFGKRDDYIKKIKENGGEYKGSVGKGLTYLVTNDTESGSSKNRKAKELGISVINENQLLEMLK